MTQDKRRLGRPSSAALVPALPVARLTEVTPGLQLDCPMQGTHLPLSATISSRPTPTGALGLCSSPCFTCSSFYLDSLHLSSSESPEHRPRHQSVEC